MARLTNWMVDARGCIVADMAAEEKSIRTSRVVQRIGMNVMTQSGSVYELDASQHPYIRNEHCRFLWYDGAKTPEDVIDWAVKKNHHLPNT